MKKLFYLPSWDHVAIWLLQDTVRNDVAATAGIEKVWMQRFKVSDMRNYVVRRYVTTPSGVFRSYPGALFHETYDPTKQPW